LTQAEKNKAFERANLLEKMSITQSEEFHKLQTKHKELKAKVKSLESSDIGQLRQENIKLELELQKKTLQIEVARIDSRKLQINLG
jgi:predicted nuclease with TOPRIM domain